jgi:hypothetical protein
VFDAIVHLPDQASIHFKNVVWTGIDVIAFITRPAAHGAGVSPTRLRRAATQQEERDASGLGGHRHGGSGSRPGYKGDGRVIGRFRTESKTTTSKSFKVTLADLRKIRSECEGLEVPIFFVQFVERGTLKPIDEWVLVPKKEWEKRAR